MITSTEIKIRRWYCGRWSQHCRILPDL